MLITEFSHLTHARLLLARSHRGADVRPLSQVWDWLSRLAHAAEVTGRTGSLMEIRLLQGCCHQLLGNDREAREVLLAALCLPEAERQAFLLVMEGAETSKALSRLLSGTRAPEWALKVLRAADRFSAGGAGKPARHAGATELLEPLSERELDVLRQLAGEHSGPEIA